jgi:hypothetical protein
MVKKTDNAKKVQEDVKKKKKVSVCICDTEKQVVKRKDITFPLQVLEKAERLAWLQQTSATDVIIRAVEYYCMKNHLIIDRYDRAIAEIHPERKERSPKKEKTVDSAR